MENIFLTCIVSQCARLIQMLAQRQEYSWTVFFVSRKIAIRSKILCSWWKVACFEGKPNVNSRMAYFREILIIVSWEKVFQEFSQILVKSYIIYLISMTLITRNIHRKLSIYSYIYFYYFFIILITKSI